MKTLNEIITEYESKIGKADERVSFLHIDPAVEAAELLKAQPEQFCTISAYNFVWRIGQILGDGKYFTAVSHSCNGVYDFRPQAL
jgi:hypothetical protein